MAAAPELIPEEEIVIRDALPTIGRLSGLIVVLGLILIIDAFTRAMFGTITGPIGWIPYANRLINAPIIHIEQKITNYLGSAERYFDALIADSFHKLARIVQHMGRELENLAADVLLASAFIVEKINPQEARHIASHIIAPLRTVVHTVTKIEQGISVRVRELEQLAVRQLRARLRNVEHVITHTLRPELKTIQEEVRDAERAGQRAWRWIRGHAASSVGTGAVAAVAFALAQLGVSWIRCSRWKKIGKKVCNNDLSFLEDLLGLSLALLSVVDPEAIAKAAIITEDGAHDIIRKIAELHDPVT